MVSSVKRDKPPAHPRARSGRPLQPRGHFTGMVQGGSERRGQTLWPRPGKGRGQVPTALAGAAQGDGWVLARASPGRPGREAYPSLQTQSLSCPDGRSHVGTGTCAIHLPNTQGGGMGAWGASSQAPGAPEGLPLGGSCCNYVIRRPHHLRGQPWERPTAPLCAEQAWRTVTGKTEAPLWVVEGGGMNLVIKGFAEQTRRPFPESDALKGVGSLPAGVPRLSWSRRSVDPLPCRDTDPPIQGSSHTCPNWQSGQQGQRSRPQPPTPSIYPNRPHPRQ